MHFRFCPPKWWTLSLLAHGSFPKPSINIEGLARETMNSRYQMCRSRIVDLESVFKHAYLAKHLPTPLLHAYSAAHAYSLVTMPHRATYNTTCLHRHLLMIMPHAWWSRKVVRTAPPPPPPPPNLPFVFSNTNCMSWVSGWTPLFLEENYLPPFKIPGPVPLIYKISKAMLCLCMCYMCHTCPKISVGSAKSNPKTHVIDMWPACDRNVIRCMMNSQWSGSSI